MLQLIYVSSRTPSRTPIDIDDLMAVAQRNNRRDQITGLLYSDGRRFLQVVEGPEEVVEDLLRRLGGDDRHRAIVMLSRRDIADREFGSWAMAMMRSGEDDHSFSSRIMSLCQQADPRVVGTFLGLIEARSAARS